MLEHNIDDLKTLVKCTKSQHQQRSSQLRDECTSLWDQTGDLKQLVFELTMKAD